MFLLFNLLHYYCSSDFFPVLKGLHDRTLLSAIHVGSENTQKKKNPTAEEYGGRCILITELPPTLHIWEVDFASSTVTHACSEAWDPS